MTVDLKTGAAHPARSSDFITKLAAVAPSEGQHHPVWSAFLEDATGGDEGLQRFLQAWCGYCLTGSTREHALLFIFGDGGNGKSVFLNTVSGILGDYATTAAMETFTASKFDRHPTDIAALRGARLVSVSEVAEGRAWDEARIKSMTGGDRITARFMREDSFTFRPQFKLTIVGNHQPVLRNTDDAMRRRFNMAPFTRKPREPDPDLEEKLRAEWPAILRWMIRGCTDWLSEGLWRPSSIVDATKEYFSEQDVFSQWLAECCDVDPRLDMTWATASALFASWKAYAEAAGERAGTAKRLGDLLARRGFVRGLERVGGRVVRVWKGLSLVQSSGLGM